MKGSTDTFVGAQTPGPSCWCASLQEEILYAKNEQLSQSQWLTPVILAIPEAEIRMIKV
jgi:hypothetical protein